MVVAPGRRLLAANSTKVYKSDATRLYFPRVQVDFIGHVAALIGPTPLWTDVW